MNCLLIGVGFILIIFGIYTYPLYYKNIDFAMNLCIISVDTCRAGEEVPDFRELTDKNRDFVSRRVIDGYYYAIIMQEKALFAVLIGGIMFGLGLGGIDKQ